MVRPHPFLTSCLAAVLLLAGPAAAQDLLWNGSTGDWLIPGNWAPAGPPGGGNAAQIDAGEAQLNAFGEAGELRLGHTPGSDGILRVGAAGLLDTGDLKIGNQGRGTLLVLGGDVTASNSLMGGTFTGRGFATVSGSTASWITAGELIVGFEFDANIAISSGATVQAGSASLGLFGSATGIVDVSGAGSTFRVLADLDIAPGGSAILTLQSGGQALVTGRTHLGTLGQINFGTGATSGTLGTTELANGGVVHFDHSDSLTFAAPITGSGNVTKAGAGDAIFTGALSYSGPTTIDGGTFTMRGGGAGMGAFDVTGAVSGSPADALLRGSGTLTLATGQAMRIGGGLPASRGHLSPGDGTTPGNWSITAPGGLIFTTGGRLRLEIAGAGLSDRLILNGALDLSSSGDGIEFMALGGAWDGSSYTVLTNTGARTGIFNSIVGLPANYQLNYLANAITLTPVPEPAGAALLLAGLAVLGARRRRPLLP